MKEEINFANMAVTKKSLISEAFSQNQQSPFWIQRNISVLHKQSNTTVLSYLLVYQTKNISILD